MPPTATAEPPVAAPADDNVSLASDIQNKIRAAFEAERAAEAAPAAPTQEAPATPETPAKETKAKTAKTAPEVAPPTLDDFTSPDEPEGEPTVEATDDTDEAPADVKAQGEKAVAKWGELRKKEKDYDRVAKENAELKARLEKAPDVAASKELETLRAALAEKEKVVAAYDVTQSEEWQQNIEAPYNSIAEAAKYLTDDDDARERIFRAIEERNPKRRLDLLEEAAEGLSPMRQSELTRIAGWYDDVKSKEASILANAQKAREEIERGKLASRQQETETEKQARIAADETVWKNITKKLPFLTDEDGKVLKEFEGVRDEARGTQLSDMSLGTQSFARYAAHLVPKMVGILAKKDSRIAELEESISALQGAAPSMGNGSAVPARVDDDTPLAKRIMTQAREAGFVR